MKQRIFSRAETLKLMTDRKSKVESGQREMLDLSIAAYLLADGKTVRVYEDRDMGGTVVEYEGG